MTSVLPGFLLSLSLILAIGAQNAFVLRQGLLGRHVFAVCLVCGLSDAVLISVGVFGLGRISEMLPAIVPVMRWGGAAFLFVYGLRSFWTALRTTEALDPGGATPVSLARTLMVCLALTWLNPHVYLDTVMLIGSVATQYPDRVAFAAGAVLASMGFFFALGYGARLLRPVFARPRAWTVLEVWIGVVMWMIAASLVFGG